MLSSVLVIASSLCMGIGPEFPGLFNSYAYTCKSGEFKGEVFQYRLFVPSGLNPKQRYPMLLWLHGMGEYGADNISQLRWLDMAIGYPDQVKQCRSFVLAVQCPPAHPHWLAGDMLGVAVQVMKEMIRRYPIDPDRICVSGVSSGGGATWEIGMRYPDLFAGLLPMASGGDASRAGKLIKTPIWAFVTSSERENFDGIVVAVKNAGGNIHLTVTPTPGHDCWTDAFRVHHIMDWMQAQRRGHTSWWASPGEAPLQPRDLLVILGILLVPACVAWRLRRRQRCQEPFALANATQRPAPADDAGGRNDESS